MIDQDEFETWKDSPVTRWVLEAFVQRAEDKRDEFLGTFFYANGADPSLAAYMRGEFFALMLMHPNELTYDAVVGMHESRELELSEDALLMGSLRGDRQ